MTKYQPAYPRRKLHRPRPIVGSVARPRLLEQLDRVLQKPVASVCAPAGFGKTTLLAQWMERCPLPNAWLQLDKNDHEIPLFLSGFVTALRQLFPDCLEQTAKLLRAQVDVPLEVWKNTLIEDLELLKKKPFILALDDYHLVGNPSVDSLLADLCYGGLSLHLILSARRSLPRSFSRLKIQEQIVEISTDDLRFTDTEALTYLYQATHVNMSLPAVHQLQEKTEGWVAGLALAAISFRADDQPDELIARIKGSDRHITDYMLDQVFNTQPVEIQEFLLKTASYNHFCAAMLSEVFDSSQGEGDIQSLLEKVEGAQLFLIPLDDQRTWYRYHHLFRQMLLSRQRFHISPDKTEWGKRRAAAWLIRQGQKEDALGYLIAMQDWSAAAQLVEGQFCALLNAEDFQGIKRLIGLFPEDVIATRPGLLLMQAWMAHFEVRLPWLQSLTTRIQAILDAAVQSDETPDSRTPPPGFETIPYRTIQSQIWALESYQYYLTNRGSQALPLAQKAVAALPKTWNFVRGNAMVYMGLSMLMEGQHHQAVELLTQAYERLHDPGNEYGARLLFTLAVIHLLHGELELCRQMAEQLLRDALANHLLLMQGWGYYLLGRVYQEWGQLELAAEYYHQTVEQRFTTQFMPSVESIAGYACILQTLGHVEQAQQFLSSLGKLHDSQSAAPPPLFVSLTAWMKLQNGSREEARRWAESFNDPIAKQAIVWYHIPHIYKIRILMETGGPEISSKVNQLLDEIQALAERTHNNFTLVRVLAMRAVWRIRQGESAAAQQTLERALRLAHPGRFIHTFVEQGPQMLGLLQSISSYIQNEPELSEYVISLIAAFLMPTKSSPTLPNQIKTETLLTNREIEILTLLVDRLTDKEIAVRLMLSPLTVKKHIQRIFRKLDIHNRRAVVAHARRLGLI